MTEVGRASNKSAFWIEEIAGSPHHSGAIWIDSHPGDSKRAVAKFDHEQDPHANGSEHAAGFHGKEITGAEHFPMAPNELFPSALANPFRRWLDPSLRQDVRHCRGTDRDLQAAKSISSRVASRAALD